MIEINANIYCEIKIMKCEWIKNTVTIVFIDNINKISDLSFS